MRTSFKIQHWRVEPSLNRLEDGDSSSHLNPKAMEVLLYLHQRAGEVCRKPEILAAVWQDTFVTEAVLTSAIWELRRAFGDDARNPTVIETIPKRGYRLIPSAIAEQKASDTFEASPQALSSTGSSRAIEQASPATKAPVGKRLGILIPLVLVMLVGSSLAIVWRAAHKQKQPDPLPQPVEIELAVLPFVNNTGDPNLDWLRWGIPDMLALDLSRSSFLRVISLETVNGLVSELDDSGNTLPEREIASQVQTRSGAQVVVSGRILQDPSSFRILAQLHDFASGRQTAEEVAAPDAEAVLELVDRIASKVRVALEVEASDLPGVEQGLARTRTGSVAAYKHFVDGKAQLEKLQFREAIAELQQATQIDPSFSHAHELLANAYDIIGEKDLAQQAIRRAVHTSDHLPEAERVMIARRQAQLEDDISAELGHLRQLVALRPRESQWLVRLAWFHVTHLRDCDSSISRYRQAIELEPEAYPYFYAYLAETYLECSNPAAALTALDTYAALLPDDPTTHSHLGNAYLWIGDYAKAERQLLLSLERQPGFALASSLLGDVYRAQGLWGQAEEQYQLWRAGAMGPSDEEAAQVALALLALDSGDFSQAVEHARSALTADPQSVPALWTLGLVEIARGEMAAAEAAEQKILALLGDTASQRFRELLQHLGGSIALASGSAEAAILAFEQALALHPHEHARFRHDLARAQIATSNLESAAKSLLRTFELNPAHAHSRCTYAEILEEQGRSPESLAESIRCREIWRGKDRLPDWIRRAESRIAKQQGISP